MVETASRQEKRSAASAALLEPSVPLQPSEQNGGSVRSLARVVVVLRDQALADATASTLVAHGILAIAFGRSEAARHDLEGRCGTDILVTSATFQPGCPNGVSLARITRRKHPCLKVVFVDRHEVANSVAEESNSFIPTPVSALKLARSVARMLQHRHL